MVATTSHIFSGKVDIASNLQVGSSHLFVDTENNRVGINTVSPDASLHDEIVKLFIFFFISFSWDFWITYGDFVYCSPHETTPLFIHCILNNFDPKYG